MRAVGGNAAGRPLTRGYQTRHGLRGSSTTQKATDALIQQELVTKDRGFVAISEPFFAEWIRRNALGQS